MEKEKKGFWASLFGSNKSSCCCSPENIVEEVKEEEIKYAPESTCCCGGEAKTEESCCCGGESKAEESCCCGGETKKEETSCCCGNASNSDGIKEIKVLGPGCAKCKATYSAIEKVLKDKGLNIKLTKIEDIAEMMAYNIMQTPAVVVDEKVVIKGHVPSEDELKKVLGL